MYKRAVPRLRNVIVMAVFAMSSTAASGQTPAQSIPAEHQHDHEAPSDSDAVKVREASGTAWLPDATPMYAVHHQRGPWQLMLHDNVFVQFLHESGKRGDDQVGSINWVMAMAQRRIGAGRLSLHGMFSIEPWSIGGCGYPDLLASGERCENEKIHDRQHPHDLLMEVSAEYDRPIRGQLRWQLYGGLAGEPAIGPVAYPHRVSAMPNPLAPIAHHWLDSTHITFGLVTAGIYGQRWKAESSLFNGREPDEHRADVDAAALDSFSGRVWILPTSTLAFQVSLAKLTEAEAPDEAGPGLDVTRATASVTYHTPATDDGMWASTIAWGRNHESGHGSSALLAETNFILHDRDAVFGRFESVRKTAHDLDVSESDEGFVVAKLQGGYTRYVRGWNQLKIGLGAAVSAGFVPAALESAYGSRMNAGFAVFANIRPAAMSMHNMSHD